MLPNERDEWRLTELNRKIDELRARTATLQLEHAAASKRAARTSRLVKYLRFLRWLRSPSEAFELWPVALLTIGPMMLGALLVAATSFVTSSIAAGLLAFVVGAAAGAAMFAWFLYRPADAVLPLTTSDAVSKRAEAQDGLRAVVEQLGAATAKHSSLVEERRALVASGKVQRAALLQRAWKTMPEAEWEDFVVEVCRTLGYSVERLPRTSTVDAAMLVALAGRSVAVVTHGEGRTVNSRAVQQALASKALHGCDGCAVIINRRFTGAAQDHARHNGCTLVGLDEFPDFVMGTLEL